MAQVQCDASTALKAVREQYIRYQTSVEKHEFLMPLRSVKRNDIY